ncbi:MAG: hypothetical protein KF868_15685 [Acidobacteria bacterium]|nr:hypothetical protein [Acidobacteriota bacterium]MCW5967523.1 hypothetical protein [Blastocatellales bacterium]
MTNPDQYCLSVSTPLFVLLASEGLNPAGIPKAINLIIFALVIYYLVRKPAREFFSRRLADVRTTLERAAKQKQEATAKLADIDARLSRLDADIAEIRAAAEREARAESERLERETAMEAERLRQMAAREIESAKTAAIVELREFAAASAVDLAEEILRRELTAEDDRKLLERAGAEIEKAK